MTPEQLLGTWHIVSWRQVYDDGRVVLPLGPDPQGVLHYTAERMACLLSRRDRLPFATGGQWNAEPDERAAAYSGFLAYAGRYSVQDDNVHHYVDVSLYPNWVGTDQVRTASMLDGELLLSARLEAGSSEARTAELAWRRNP